MSNSYTHFVTASPELLDKYIRKEELKNFYSEEKSNTSGYKTVCLHGPSILGDYIEEMVEENKDAKYILWQYHSSDPNLYDGEWFYEIRDGKEKEWHKE